MMVNDDDDDDDGEVLSGLMEKWLKKKIPFPNTTPHNHDTPLSNIHSIRNRTVESTGKVMGR